MAGVLLTGFEPFDGETVNPSWEVVKQLDGTMIAGQPVIARQLPCVFGEALSVLYAAIEDLAEAGHCRGAGRRSRRYQR